MKRREKKYISTNDSQLCANFVEGRGADNTATDIASYTELEKAGSTGSGELNFYYHGLCLTGKAWSSGHPVSTLTD